jgi:hypothetical protein
MRLLLLGPKSNGIVGSKYDMQFVEYRTTVEIDLQDLQSSYCSCNRQPKSESLRAYMQTLQRLSV